MTKLFSSVKASKVNDTASEQFQSNIYLLYSHDHYTYTYADACRIITTTQ